MTFINRVTSASCVERRYRIGFLFNHEAAHQVAHSAPIAAQLALSDRQAEIMILATSDAVMQRAWSLCAPEARNRIEFVQMCAPVWPRIVARTLDAVVPFSRITTLIQYKELLAKFDLLVVPERTTLFLRTLLGQRTPLLVHTKHGSGDRAQGYKPVVGKFDLVLASGAKIRDRLVSDAGVAPQKCVIVGYSKFDTITDAPPRFFNNGKPTVVYNPHPQPGLSSWFGMGLSVLDYFSQHDEFNLIFAPHVMLFKRKIHFSMEQFRFRLRREIPQRFFKCENILIDTGSAKSLDMSYLRAADIYLGDASSQVYEFLIKPRPMVFLNPDKKPWRGDVNYSHWYFGPVVSDIANLDAALRDCIVRPERYRQAQERGFHYTFDLSGKPSSKRAAEAISLFARQTLFPARLFPSQGHAIDAAGGRIDAV